MLRRTWQAVLAFVLIGGALMLLSAKPSEISSSDSPSDVGATPASGDAIEMLCSSRMAQCLNLKHRVTAVLYRSSQKEPRGVLLWDAGGPGALPLDSGAARAALPGWTIDYDVVTLTEPWMAATVESACLQGLRGDPGRRSSGCSWSDLVLDVHQYQSILDELEARVAPLAGVLAESFGAVRALPAIDRVLGRGGFAVVASPSPLPDQAGADILRARMRAAKTAIMNTPPCGKRDCSRRRDRLEALLAGQIDGVTARHAELAVLAMSANLDDNTRFLAKLWSGDGQLTRVGEASLRQVARQFGLTTGSGMPLPAQVGYLAGVCAMYSGWETAGDARSRGGFAALHRWCAEVPNSGYRDWFQRWKASSGSIDRLYLVVNRLDPVVPWVYQSRWRYLASPERVKEILSPGHVSAPRSVMDEVGSWVAQSRR